MRLNAKSVQAAKYGQGRRALECRAALGTSVMAGGAAIAAAAVAYKKILPTDVQFQLASAAGAAVRAVLDAENAHTFAIFAARSGLLPTESRPNPEILKTTVWGRTFPNPIGMAAGFDKHAEAMEGMLNLGFGFVEIGSVTPKAQPGNPKPRVFRVPELKAVINRYGFNSLGADAVQSNLEAYSQRAKDVPSAKPGLLGVNLGKNKTSEDAAADYSEGLIKLGGHADYLVINVSSPNTPGLRSLQGRRELGALVAAVKATRDGMTWGPGGAPPLLVKVAPDLSEPDMTDVAAVAQLLGVDGLVVSNTTLSRIGAEHLEVSKEAGGYSGPPLMALSTAVLSELYRLTEGKIPIIGCGGVGSGEDAYRKIRAGASLVQLYTTFVYDGPALIPRIKAELAECLRRDGFTSVSQAVGVDVRVTANVSA